MYQNVILHIFELRIEELQILNFQIPYLVDEIVIERKPYFGRLWIVIVFQSPEVEIEIEISV